MLVLTRKLNETIRIGDNVEVTVSRIEGDTVRLVIQAPRDVAIYRGELYERIRAANRGALLPTPPGKTVVLPNLSKLSPK